MRMDLLPILHLKRAAADGRVEARVHAQVESLTRKDTREGKPFYAAVLADAGAKMTLRAWSDGPAFEFCEKAKAGAFVEVAGEFTMSPGFGLDSKRWTIRELTPDELAELLDGQVDVVFANEDEASAWQPAGPEAALEDLAGRVGIVAVIVRLPR